MNEAFQPRSDLCPGVMGADSGDSFVLTRDSMQSMITDGYFLVSQRKKAGTPILTEWCSEEEGSINRSIDRSASRSFGGSGVSSSCWPLYQTIEEVVEG